MKEIKIHDPSNVSNYRVLTPVTHQAYPHNPDGKLPDDFALGYLLNTECREEYIKGFTQNFFEFYSFKYRKFHQLSASTETELFEKALARGFTKLLVIKQGNILKEFVEKFRDEYQEKWKDVTLAGHILDRGDNYWQIHPQLFYIDLSWWQRAGKPRFGVRDINNPEPYEAVTPVRSTETLVEGEWYNPVSVEPGTETKTYTGQWEGGELLRAVFADPDARVVPWPEYMRDQKDYLYPEMPDFWEQNHVLSRNFMETSGWYVANNEPFHEVVPKGKHLKVLISHAGGLSPWLNAYINNIMPVGHIRIIDISGIGLAMQERLFKEWDGVDWEKYVNNIIAENPQLDRHNFRGQQNLKSQSDQIKALPGFTEWWQSDVRKNLKVQYIRQDFLNYRWHIRHMTRALEAVNEDEILYIDMSNVFNYEYTNVLADLNSRIKIEDEYLLFFLKNRRRIYFKTIILDDVYRTTSMRDLFPWSPRRDV